ncbi:hypothetical protein H4Q26_011543 [Puccinia striiformis f. sp. tritici PST-130]|nr:hypothetical protein H4Q26_011543 [Puccinia striiformis f. sp. tritici PST-130]
MMMALNFFTISTSRASHLIATSAIPSARSVRLTVRQFSVTSSRASHIGSKPIEIPSEVTLSFSYPVRPRTSTSSIPHGYPQVSVRGKLGKLDLDVLPFVTFTFESPTTSRILGADLEPTPLTSPGKFVVEAPAAVPQDVISGPGILKVTVEDGAVKNNAESGDSVGHSWLTLSWVSPKHSPLHSSSSASVIELLLKISLQNLTHPTTLHPNGSDSTFE